MEPITISAVVLGTAFAMEGIKFLWKQADTIVNRHNDRKYKALDTQQEAADAALATVETAAAPEFLDLPATLTIDFDRAEECVGELGELRNSLTPYVLGELSPTASNDTLKGTLDTVQQMLESIYHHPLQVTEETRRNIVAATGGGTVQLNENVQHVKETGENVISADGDKSSVTIGTSRQSIG